MAKHNEADGLSVERDEADQQFDGLAVENRDPKYHYRWARKRDINVARHKFHGYEVVDQTDDKVRSVLDDHSTRMKKGSDNTTAVEVGDLVLMRIPKEKHEEIIKRRQRKIDRMAVDMTSQYRQNVRRIAGAASRGRDLSFEEHTDNPSMKGMSEKAYDKMIEEERHERQREVEKLGLNK